MAELCVQHGWSWFDQAGNCHLDVPGVLRIEQTGRVGERRPSQPTVNLGTPEAAQVLRVLVDPELSGTRWTQRNLRNHCRPGVSLGMVNKVVAHLRNEAFLENVEPSGFRVGDPPRLLQVWRDAYRFDRNRRESWFTRLQGGKLKEALAELEMAPAGAAAYAAFSAADFQAPDVRQSKTWIYVSEDLLPRFAKLLNAKPVDSGDNLQVLIPPDAGVFYQADGGEPNAGRLACTHPIQTYVDLCHSGGRGSEAAAAIWDQLLVPAWRKRGVAV